MVKGNLYFTHPWNLNCFVKQRRFTFDYTNLGDSSDVMKLNHFGQYLVIKRSAVRCTFNLVFKKHRRRNRFHTLNTPFLGRVCSKLAISGVLFLAPPPSISKCCLKGGGLIKSNVKWEIFIGPPNGPKILGIYKKAPLH